LGDGKAPGSKMKIVGRQEVLGTRIKEKEEIRKASAMSQHPRLDPRGGHVTKRGEVRKRSMEKTSNAGRSKNREGRGRTLFRKRRTGVTWGCEPLRKEQKDYHEISGEKKNPKKTTQPPPPTQPPNNPKKKKKQNKKKNHPQKKKHQKKRHPKTPKPNTPQTTKKNNNKPNQKEKPKCPNRSSGV